MVVTIININDQVAITEFLNNGTLILTTHCDLTIIRVNHITDVFLGQWLVNPPQLTANISHSLIKQVPFLIKETLGKCTKHRHRDDEENDQ